MMGKKLKLGSEQAVLGLAQFRLRVEDAAEDQKWRMQEILKIELEILNEVLEHYAGLDGMVGVGGLATAILNDDLDSIKSEIEREGL